MFSAAEVPFSRWSKDEVCGWMHEQGLGPFAAQGQSWIKSGQTLLQASQHDLEKVELLVSLRGRCPAAIAAPDWPNTQRTVALEQ